MDLTTITAAIGLAGTAAGATSKAAESIKTLTSLFSKDSVPDSDEAANLLNGLAVELTTANMMNVQISVALRTLSQELQQQNEFANEKARYELFRTGQNDMVYRLKSDLSQGQPDHFICPVCLNQNKMISFVTGEGDYKTCQTDRNHNFEFSNNPDRFGGRNGQY